MSWKNDLLVRKGGEFTIIWSVIFFLLVLILSHFRLLAHGKQGKRTKILNAVNDLDITEKWFVISDGYINSGFRLCF